MTVAHKAARSFWMTTQCTGGVSEIPNTCT